MEKEKRILFYFIGWFIVALCIFLIGVINVDAEEITPTTGFRTQVGSINVSNGDTAWNTSAIGQYNSPLYFTQGQEYYNFFTPGYIRLAVISDLDSRYNYKLSYKMNIYELNVSNWKVSDIDKNYNLLVNDDISIIKESKCSVVSTNVINGINGTTLEKDITCTFSLNYSTSNAWINSGYICKDCTLSGIQNLGTVSSDSYMYVINPKLERFEDNSSVIIDQNQTIIDQNNKTNEELGNIKDEIKNQFESCRNSVNLITSSSFKMGSTYAYYELEENQPYILSIKLKENGTQQSYFLGFTDRYDTVPTYYRWLLSNGTLQGTTSSDGFVYINNLYNSVRMNYVAIFPKDGTTIESLFQNYDIQLVKGSSYKPYEKYGQICSNKIDETNDKLDNLQNSITDSSSPDIDGLADSAGWLPPGPLDSVLNLPLSLFNSLTTNLNKSCSAISIPLPYVNKNLTIPCINTLYDKIGVSTFISWLGVIVSGLMLYTYLLKLYKWIEDRISLNETHSVDNWGGL